MEKFCLKWNDFQSTVSKSFSLLKQEKEFFDVTLVSDDQLQIPTHKIVLSACSKFFKSVLTKNPHSHPLIYLHGINSTNLNFILDYIYQGEVQIYREQLHPFLDAAQKLEIDGLTSIQKEEGKAFSHDEEQSSKKEEEENTMIFNYSQETDVSNFDIESNSKVNANRARKKICYDLATTNDKSEVDQKIKELLVKSDTGYECIPCGKTGKDNSNMKKHAESHIEGLSYNCQQCDRTYRSRNTLSTHYSTFHRGFSYK